MSLYHEAANILESVRKGGGSVKSLVFSKKTWKSELKTLFALATEAAKWSEVLSEVIEKSAVLRLEKSISPNLALVLTHDLLLSKKGIALPANHGLARTISRHKARLSAELTKLRLRKGFATIDELRAHVNGQVQSAHDHDTDGRQNVKHPRWLRINTLKSSLESQLSLTFFGYDLVTSLDDLHRQPSASEKIYLDKNIPDLVAVHPNLDSTISSAQVHGRVIFQDKASCFPAYLLNAVDDDGDIVDACAAPGNKTTHLAAILHTQATSDSKERKIFACEKDPTRSETLAKMVKLAGAEQIVEIKAKQNFLKLDPHAREFANVTALLLDPSCSGSGTMGRDEGGVTVHLPSVDASVATEPSGKRSKKRKRNQKLDEPPPIDLPEPDTVVEQEAPESVIENQAQLQVRLAALSDFQLRLLQHAMSFPAAKRITYSTCSLYVEENENVVVHALGSAVARERGWRIMLKDEQVDGMRRWHRRGKLEAVQTALQTLNKGSRGDSTRIGSCQTAIQVAEACIRCEKGGEDGTMSFFVTGFVREVGNDGDSTGSHDDIVDEESSDEGPESDDMLGPRHNWKDSSDELNGSITAATEQVEHKSTEDTGTSENDEWQGFGDDPS